MTPYCEVIGSPISHSLSPVLHQAAYRQLGLDWQYTAKEVLPGELPDYLSGLGNDCKGISVTMPHKQAVMQFLDALDPLASAVGAVNTIAFSHQVVTGFNTDVYGIVTALRECAGGEPAVDSASSGQLRADNWQPSSAAVLGAGATAASALAALGELGVEQIAVVARNKNGPNAALLAARRMGIRPQLVPWSGQAAVRQVLTNADVIVSTVPAGVADTWVGQFTPKSGAVLLDVVYAPWPSALVQHFQQSGAQVAPGWLMLVHQAFRQIQLFTGQTPCVDTMKKAIVAHLAGREAK